MTSASFVGMHDKGNVSAPFHCVQPAESLKTDMTLTQHTETHVTVATAWVQAYSEGVMTLHGRGTVCNNIVQKKNIQRNFVQRRSSFNPPKLWLQLHTRSQKDNQVCSNPLRAKDFSQNCLQPKDCERQNSHTNKWQFKHKQPLS